MVDLSGRIAVLGLGRSGTAAVQWALARPGRDAAGVVVFVEDDTPKLREAAAALRAGGVRVVLGADRVPDEGFAVVVASPGIAPHRPLMISACSLGIPVISELELAYLVAQAPIVAVTGTNGKTTVTSLVTHLLRTAGMNAVSAGNIGVPALDAAREVGPRGVIVAECSSFQLALTFDFHPRVAVLLNVTPDHIDWHGSMEAYAADKARVFANLDAGDVAVVDIDDPGSAVWAETVSGRGIPVVRVGRDAPTGARVSDGVLVVDLGAGDIELVATGELLIKGTHNISNALAASAAALAAGANAEAVRAGLRTFAPIEHRLEPVGTVDGVSFVNDSKATNPDAVLKALTAFDDRPLIVLLGGRNKGNDFTELAGACGARCKLAVLYGEARPELEVAFRATGAPFAVATDMLQALEVARSQALSGDVVLLSPACASFDGFANYEERGRAFAGAVARLGGAPS